MIKSSRIIAGIQKVSSSVAVRSPAEDKSSEEFPVPAEYQAEEVSPAVEEERLRSFHVNNIKVIVCEVQRVFFKVTVCN